VAYTVGTSPPIRRRRRRAPRPIPPTYYDPLASLRSDISLSGPGYGLPSADTAGGPAATDISSSGPGYGLPGSRPVIPGPPAKKPTSAATAAAAAAAAAGKDPLAAANAYADALLGPYQAEIRRQQAEALADAERRAGFQRDVASALAHELAGIAPQIQGVYQEAAGTQTAMAKGFSDGLRMSAEKSAGQANDLMSTLAGAPDAQKISGDRATAVGDVAYGLGGYIPGSTLNREGAAFSSAAAFLPNTALGEGARSARAELAAGAKAKQDLENQWLTTLAQQRPQLIQSYLTDAAQTRSQGDNQALSYAKSVAATFTANSDHVYVPKRDASGAWQIFDAGPKTRGATKPNRLIITGSDKTGRVAVDPITGQVVAQVSAPVKPGAPKPPAVKLFKGADGRTWRYDPITNTAVPVVGPPAKAPTSTTKAPTPGQLNGLVDSWYQGKPSSRRVRAPELDANGNPVFQIRPGPRTGQLTYQQAYRRLRALNVADQQARQLLDTRYKRGERGRPWLALPQRTTLRKAGVNPNANYRRGSEGMYAYLTRRQALVLQQAGLLPPGKWTPSGGAFLIEEGY
jgi:hypothetical protein